MNWQSGLSRQVLVSMVTVTVSSLLVTLLGSFAFYTFLMSAAPHLLSDTIFPNGIDLIIMSLFCLIGIGVAALASFRLAQRILEPLNSVAESARKIAEGDLSARANPGDRSLGETAILVDNFNSMASFLENAKHEVDVWNALIAHELRTPVTILLGRLQGLEDGVFKPDPSLFSALRKQAESLARLVEDLRTVTLSHNGNLQLQKQNINLASELEALALVHEAQITEAGFSLKTELKSCWILADPARIRQAVMVLIDNALRYADPCELRLIAHRTGRGAEILVIDRGPGLEAGFQDVAFEPFRRGSAQEALNQSGSGLGLAVVRAITQAHQGSVRYFQKRGDSIFRLYFPGT